MWFGERNKDLQVFMYVLHIAFLLMECIMVSREEYRPASIFPGASGDFVNQFRHLHIFSCTCRGCVVHEYGLDEKQFEPLASL